MSSSVSLWSILKDHEGHTVEEMVAALRSWDDESPESHFDVELLRETVQWAKKSMEVEEPFGMTWYQGDWLSAQSADIKATRRDQYGRMTVVAENFCNTAGCIAGNIAMSRGEPIWLKTSSGLLSAESVRTPEGEVSIEEFAQGELGLTSDEASLMFNGGNTYQRVEKLAETFCVRRGVEW